MTALVEYSTMLVSTGYHPAVLGPPPIRISIPRRPDFRHAGYDGTAGYDVNAI